MPPALTHLQFAPIQLQELRPVHLPRGELGGILLQVEAVQPLTHLLTGPVVDGGKRLIQELGRRPRRVRGEGLACGWHPGQSQRPGPAHLIRRLGQRVVGVGALGLLPGTTRDLGAAAGGCGVITQGGFLDRKGVHGAEQKAGPSSREFPQPTHPQLDGDVLNEAPGCEACGGHGARTSQAGTLAGTEETSGWVCARGTSVLNDVLQ